MMTTCEDCDEQFPCYSWWERSRCWRCRLTENEGYEPWVLMLNPGTKAHYPGPAGELPRCKMRHQYEAEEYRRVAVAALFQDQEFCSLCVNGAPENHEPGTQQADTCPLCGEGLETALHRHLPGCSGEFKTGQPAGLATDGGRP